MNRYTIIKNRFMSNLLFFSSMLMIMYTPINSADSSLIVPFTAATPPEPGHAVIAKPETLSIVPPFIPGDKRKITFGYKEGETHALSQCLDEKNGKTKDCFALDFGGEFEVVAVADGDIR